MSIETESQTSRKQVEAVQAYCQKYLSQDRYEHLVRVYNTMCEFNETQRLGISDRHLAITGFGHDIARELPGEISGLLVLQSGVVLEPWERQYKLFCHNKAGVYILRQCFGIEDEEIFQAVEHHTLGNSGLCTLAKLLYIADFMEPKRPFLKEGERQSYMLMELNQVVYQVCRRTAEFLKQSHKPLLPPTRAMIQELEEELAIAADQRFVL